MMVKLNADPFDRALAGLHGVGVLVLRAPTP